ncbi:PPE domain-containing protein [Nocardia tengchongensis]|uniref:PPE domain-containing protein n=1 Tax=Nocardia tengchongensis TaxID=2055889 RepID=A0ABX8CSX8_9NOCA|nr:PPE domain-containing protein [Nocardia tengchongensis]QVI22647.1 PPE domain-containing protein [Nocardia tengchongensis]
MTLGITGVCWLPRMAEINSVTLNTGAHAIPIAAAGSAWSGLTAAWVDATTTVARVMAEIGVGLEGSNGLTVLARLGGFAVWAEQQAVMAGIMAGKANANATAYTVASIAMPSLPEIALVETARVAAYSSGGALNGSAEAAEAAKLALDIRAALVMETYEAATSLMVTTPGQFLMPPPIAMGAGSAGAGGDAFAEGGDPVQAALGAAATLAQNPAVTSALSQVAQVAGTVATDGVTSVGNVASSAITAVANAMTQSPGLGTSGFPGMGTAGAGGAALTTHAVSYVGGGSVNIGNGAGTLRLPEGWSSGLGGTGGLGNPGGATGPAAPVAEPMGVVGTPASTAPVRSAGTGSLLGQQGGDEDETRRGHDYGRSVEVFADGRVVAPAVIGADPVDADAAQMDSVGGANR